jgi:peptidoglycan/xylan/chitin deacetylase (PgdA/CDA1 family)
MSSRISYRGVFRLVFVLFYIYLIGNVFYLWGQFKDYASSEFLPSVALVSVLWTGIAVFTALLLWLICRVFEKFFSRKEWKIRIEHVSLYIGVFILSGTLIWAGKKLLLPQVQMTLQLKLIVSIILTLISIVPTWLFRSKAEQWVNIVQKIVTPLVWLFSILVILSVPPTLYYIWQEIQICMTGNSNNQPLVTFVFDDGYELVYTRAKPIFDAQGEVACAAIVLDYIDKPGRMTKTQILELQNDGWEIASHTVTHPDLTTLSGPEIEKELKNSKDGLTALGFKITNFVYPFYKHNATVRKIARKYYRSARSGDEWTTGLNVNPHILRMYALSAADLESPEHLRVLKDYVDYIEAANNSWLMVTIHNVIPYREAMLNSLIDYIQSKDIKIVTINQALDLIGEQKESKIARLLFILNNDSPANILRNVHIISQRLLGLLQNILVN